MRYYNTTSGVIITYEQASRSLKNPTTNPTNTHFAAEGILPLVEYAGPPEGFVAVPSNERVVVVDGIASVAYDLITVEAHEADNEAARIAAEAAEAERKATPIIYDQPLQARIETPASDGHVYGIEVDPDGGELVPVQRESVRKTQAEYEIEKAARMAERQQHRQRLAAIKTDLDAVEAAVDQIDVTAGGSLGGAIAATTVVNKTAMTEIRKALVDIKAAIKNLRQATEKLRKDAK